MLLDSAAHSEASALGRWGTDARVDALPYVDVEEGEWKEKAEELLRQEMRRSQKSVQDYLAELPPMPSFFTAESLIGQEMARVEANKPLPPVDQSRFRLEPPPLNRRNDVNAWKTALANARAQLEHQGLRMTNLELLFRYGANAWKAHINHLEASAHISDAMLQEYKAATDAVNQERKLQQEAIGKQLHGMSRDWSTLVQKNMDIGMECSTLESEIAALQDEEDASLKAGASSDAPMET